MSKPISEPHLSGAGWGHSRVVLQDGQRTLLFQDPQEIITVTAPQDVERALAYIDEAVSSRNLYAAGYLSYEAAAAFELATHEADADGLPLLWFCLYREARELEVLIQPYGDYQVGSWQAAVDWSAYEQAIEAIKSYIAAGYTYQVNYTLPLQATFSGDPWALYRHLTESQRSHYMAYLDLGRFVICSASPELFFIREEDRLHSRPMKGTATRGRTLAEDRAQMNWLQNSEKNRAENVMIVDMIRNDFGRIAQVGSVTVPELFTVERYPTVLQMTSTVAARSQANLPQIMRAMFPCASITGAPKVRTMEIIKELEPAPRSIYTGSIGYLAPDGRISFNVAIRTVVIDRQKGRATYGVGGGIVWDSEAELEYEECFLKAQVLVQRRPSFELLETLRWTPRAGYYLLDLHLERLAESADYFEFTLDLPQVKHHLIDSAADFLEAMRVRLLVDQRGAITVEATPLPEVASGLPLQCTLAPKPISSRTVWLFHKTTNRAVYEQARAACPQADEVILWNENGELTEGTTTNLVLDLDGRLLTPPITCGLLDGILRRHLLAQGAIQEQRLLLADLHRARKVWVINSVRGWREAVISEHK